MPANILVPPRNQSITSPVDQDPEMPPRCQSPFNRVGSPSPIGLSSTGRSIILPFTPGHPSLLVCPQGPTEMATRGGVVLTF
ncbi:hypothetical protein ACS0TY_032918 [Phlomoides rotata]